MSRHECTGIDGTSKKHNIDGVDVRLVFGDIKGITGAGNSCSNVDVDFTTSVSFVKTGTTGTIGIVTNKPRVFTDLILDHLGINSMFDIVLCPDDGFKPKPDNQMFLEVFDKLNVGHSQVIYVGDGERDIIAANASNIISVFASYGYIDPSENTETWGYDLLINSTDDLKKLIDIFSLRNCLS